MTSAAEDAEEDEPEAEPTEQAEVRGPLARARRLLEGMTARLESHEGPAISTDGDVATLSSGKLVVATLSAMEGHVRVDLDPRAGIGDPAALRNLGSPHPDVRRSAAGWRRVLVRTRADAARVVNGLRTPREKSTGDVLDAASRRAARIDEVFVGRVCVRRLEDPARDGDGVRVFVDAEWPKDMPRDAVAISEWVPEAAPSALVRRAYGLTPSRDAKFRRAYLSELRGSSKAEAVSRLRRFAREGRLTLLTAVRDVAHSAAWVLARAVSQPRTPTV